MEGPKANEGPERGTEAKRRSAEAGGIWGGAP